MAHHFAKFTTAPKAKVESESYSKIRQLFSRSDTPLSIVHLLKKTIPLFFVTWIPLICAASGVNGNNQWEDSLYDDTGPSINFDIETHIESSEDGNFDDGGGSPLPPSRPLSSSQSYMGQAITVIRNGISSTANSVVEAVLPDLTLSDLHQKKQFYTEKAIGNNPTNDDTETRIRIVCQLIEMVARYENVAQLNTYLDQYSTGKLPKSVKTILAFIDFNSGIDLDEWEQELVNLYKTIIESESIHLILPASPV